MDSFMWCGIYRWKSQIFGSKPLLQCPIKAGNLFGMNYRVYWYYSEVRKRLVQGIKTQSQKPENDINGPKSENLDFFGRNLFAMYKLAIF